jgi:hypothetical protein
MMRVNPRPGPCSKDGSITIWDLPNRCQEFPLRCSAAVTCSAWSDDGTMLVCGAKDGALSLWRFSKPSSGASSAGGVHSHKPTGTGPKLGLASSTPVQETHAHKGAVTCCAWHYGGSKLLTGGADGAVVLWRVLPEELEQATAVTRHDQPVQTCAIWPGAYNDYVLASDNDGFGVQQALLRTKMDTYNVRYVENALPLLQPHVSRARQRGCSSRLQHPPLPASQRQQDNPDEQQLVCSTQLFKVFGPMPLAAAVQADGAAASYVTGSGQVKDIDFKVSIGRKLWQQAGRQVQQHKQQTRQKLRQVVSKASLKSTPGWNDELDDVPKVVSRAHGGVVAVAFNSKDGDGSTVQSIVQVHDRRSPGGSGGTGWAALRLRLKPSAYAKLHEEALGQYKVTALLPIPEAG